MDTRVIPEDLLVYFEAARDNRCCKCSELYFEYCWRVWVEQRVVHDRIPLLCHACSRYVGTSDEYSCVKEFVCYFSLSASISYECVTLCYVLYLCAIVSMNVCLDVCPFVRFDVRLFC